MPCLFAAEQPKKIPHNLFFFTKTNLHTEQYFRHGPAAMKHVSRAVRSHLDAFQCLQLWPHTPKIIYESYNNLFVLLSTNDRVSDTSSKQNNRVLTSGAMTSIQWTDIKFCSDIFFNKSVSQEIDPRYVQENFTQKIYQVGHLAVEKGQVEKP